MKLNVTLSKSTVVKTSFMAMMMIAPVAQLVAQNVLGHVVDSKTKEPLVGAMVTVKGTDLKTVTDANGKFQLQQIKEPTCTLVITYMGYQTQNIDGVQTKPSVS